MRPLEFAVVALVVSFSFLALWRSGDGAPRVRRARFSAVIAALSVVVAAAHVAIDGPRWQMIGAYVGVTAVVLVAIGRVAAVRARQVPNVARPSLWFVRRALFVVLVTSLLGASLVPAVALPVPPLPAPTGPYEVGTDATEFVVSPGRDDVRRVRARVWYPAAPADGASTGGVRNLPRTSTNWLEHVGAMLPELAVRAGLPPWSLSHLRHTRTYSRWGAPAADGRFGVVTFSHGRAGFAAQNTFYAEELASHGWIVVAPEHPGGAVLTVFRDGTEVPYDPSSFGESLSGAAYDDAIRALGRRWAHETVAALDALTDPDRIRTLAGRVDGDRVVTSGHSTGGGAAFLACSEIPGCIGAIGLDPWMLPTPPEMWQGDEAVGVPAPVLGMFSDPVLGFFEPSNHAAFTVLADVTRDAGFDVVDVTIEGAGHMDFADVTLLSPFAAAIGLDVGPAPASEVLPLIRARVVQWLDDLPQGPNAP